MEQVMFDEVVRTDYGQFDLVWGDSFGFDGDFEPFFEGQVNGLVGAGRGDGVYLSLARRSGGSSVRMVLVDAEPPAANDMWEDVVEVSTMIPAGATVGWQSWAGESHGDLDGLVPGSYRLRVSARGRDHGSQDECHEGVIDWYLLEFWPSEAHPDDILRIGSENAKYWHRENGSRR